MSREVNGAFLQYILIMGVIGAGVLCGEKYWWVGSGLAFAGILAAIYYFSSRGSAAAFPKLGEKFTLDPHTSRAMEKSGIPQIARAGRVLTQFQDELRTWPPDAALLAHKAVEALISKNADEYKSLLAKLNADHRGYVHSVVRAFTGMDEEEPEDKPRSVDINAVLERTVGGDGSWLSAEAFEAYWKSLKSEDMVMAGTIAVCLWKQDGYEKSESFRKAVMLMYWGSRGKGHMKTVATKKMADAMNWTADQGDQGVQWLEELLDPEGEQTV